MTAIDQVHATFQDRFAATGIRVPLADGSTAQPINLDFAASTPALHSVQTTVERLLSWYSSVHRSAGFTSQVCTHAYEEARAIVGQFVGVRPGQHVVIFGANTTWALNKLARRIHFPPSAVVLTSQLEHHANDLPWRQVAQVAHIGSDAQGRLDLEHAATLLRRYAGRVRLVTVTGGSNVTGVIPPIRQLAELAHATGAEIAVDCAQLAPHRPIDLGDLADPTHLDYIAFSGHKLYAPFGGGALIGRRDTFATGVPESVGGGTVRRVALDEVEWADAPARDEAGTPNLVGAVALAAAVRELEQIGMDHVAAHEIGLTAYALERLSAISGVRIYGDRNPANANTRLGVIPLAIDDVDHRLAAAVLSYEHAIAVRSGAFCAHPYVRHLLDNDAASCEAEGPAAGLLRVSIGLSTTYSDIDALVGAVEAVARNHYGEYCIDQDGSIKPRGWQQRPSDYFSI